MGDVGFFFLHIFLHILSTSLWYFFVSISQVDLEDVRDIEFEDKSLVSQALRIWGDSP
jgi:hypothetical protein